MFKIHFFGIDRGGLSNGLPIYITQYRPTICAAKDKALHSVPINAIEPLQP